MRITKIRPFGIFSAAICGFATIAAVYSDQPAGRITLTAFCFGFACRNAIDLDDDDIDFGGRKKRTVVSR